MKRACLLFLLALVAAACSGGGGGGTDVSAPGDTQVLQPEAGQDCTDVESFEIQGNQHVEVGTQVTYGTAPPTSGPHWGEWYDAGIYEEDLIWEKLVHNLEHGHVVIRYHSSLAAAERSAITQAVLVDPVMTVVAPDADQPWKLAMSSWGRAQVCTEIPADAADVIRGFIEDNRDHAPESIP